MSIAAVDSSLGQWDWDQKAELPLTLSIPPEKIANVLNVFIRIQSKG
jgi:hypothetical protein